MANEKRLISVDNAISHYKALTNIEWNQRVSPASWADAYDEFIEYLKEAHTVDAVEVVQAHWEDGYAVDPKTGRIIYRSIDCSHCEEVFKIESHDREYWKDRFKVCPFCGALMDGGNEDG